MWLSNIGINGLVRCMMYTSGDCYIIILHTKVDGRSLLRTVFIAVPRELLYGYGPYPLMRTVRVLVLRAFVDLIDGDIDWGHAPSVNTVHLSFSECEIMHRMPLARYILTSLEVKQG